MSVQVTGCSLTTPPVDAHKNVADSSTSGLAATLKPNNGMRYRIYRNYGRLEAHALGPASAVNSAGILTAKTNRPNLSDWSANSTRTTKEAFQAGRYERSKARLPENISSWRSEPDISNPGSDLANFPNSAFTLPQGSAYVEVSGFSYYGRSKGSPEQYNAEFLTRYGVTDTIELRIFSNGPTWTGGETHNWAFSPLAFDTKMFLFAENEAYFLPAMGVEAYIQTEWLGNSITNGGTQPSISFNFDQSLPLDIDFEYNLGAVRTLNYAQDNEWQFNFQWALQRNVFSDDFDLFVHGYYNASNLPRGPRSRSLTNYSQYGDTAEMRENAVGGGFLWTVNSRLALYGQASGGTTDFTPSLITYFGFAAAL
ncbi:MAG: transporter [Methylococcaceae bacterium]|jgi:hypothetical protein